MTDDQIDGLVPMPEPVDELCQEDGFNVLGAVGVFTADQLTAHTRAAVRAALEVQRQDLQNCLELIWALGRELNCLPSTFSDSNGHILKAAIKLNAERDDLRQEVERLWAELGQLTAYSDALNERCIADAAEIGRLRADAERYRWLRNRLPGSAYRIAGVIYSEGGAGVDAAIDAAMAADKAQREPR